MYIYIYMFILYVICVHTYIPIDLAVIVFFTFSSMTVALHLQCWSFGSNTPFVDYFVGTSLMEMFLWIVGSFCVFDETWDLTDLLQATCSFVETTCIALLIVYLQRSIIVRFGKLYFVSRKALIAFIFGRSFFFLVQIRWLENVNCANNVGG